MRISTPFISSILKGIKTLFFHPMLYIAILLHWGLLNLPSPVEQSEKELEEISDNSIPIASSTSLGVKSKRAKSGTDDKADQISQNKKNKSKPLAEALVKSDPELAKLAEEKKRQDEEKRKAEEARKKLEEEKKKAANSENKDDTTSNENEIKDSQSSKDITTDSKSDDAKHADQSKNDASDEENKNEDSGDDSTNGNGEGVQEFNLELLPNPELIFTSDSLAAYNPGFTTLELLPNVADARILETTTSTQKAIQAITQLPEYQSVSFGTPIYDDSTAPEESGMGVVYEIEYEGSTKYVSFIRRSSRWARKNKKNTLRSTMVFVLWSENPVS